MCAGKLLNLIKKCLHREKSGQKSDKLPGQNAKNPPSPHRAGVQPGGTPKKCRSPRAGHCCCTACYHQQLAGGGAGGGGQQLSAAASRSGYQRLCPAARTAATANDPCHCSGSNCYVTSPVAYMPGMPMDHLEQEVALQRERQIRFHAVQTDMELNLPPAIRISKDGEEGYVHSQRLLQLSWTADRRRESICPPPNKTVYQGDSPPPYRSNSVGKVEGQCVNGKRSLLANKLSCGGGNSPRISHCPSLAADKRPHGCTTGSSHGRLTPCSPTPLPTQSCCHRHACHGSHGSQLPTSHLSHSPHSYGSGQPCPNRNSSALQHGTQAACHNALVVQCGKNNSEHHGYYGPPPDYSELAPPATPPTSTLQQQQQQQQVQSDSHV